MGSQILARPKPIVLVEITPEESTASARDVSSLRIDGLCVSSIPSSLSRIENKPVAELPEEIFAVDQVVGILLRNEWLSAALTPCGWAGFGRQPKRLPSIESPIQESWWLGTDPSHHPPQSSRDGTSHIVVDHHGVTLADSVITQGAGEVFGERERMAASS